MVYCPKCGSNNSDGSKFCGNCGNSLQINSFNEEQQTDNQNNLFENKVVLAVFSIVFLLCFLKGIYDWILPAITYVSYYEQANPLITFIFVVGGFYGTLYFLGKLLNVNQMIQNVLCLFGWALLFIKGLLDAIWEIFFSTDLGFTHNPFMTLILIVGGICGVFLYLGILDMDIREGKYSNE